MKRFLLCVFLTSAAQAQSTVEIQTFKMKGGVLNYSLRAVNDTDADQLIYWETLAFCPSTNPGLLNVSSNQYIELMPVGYNNWFVHSDFITPFPKDASVVIDCEVLLPDEALPVGNYRFTATHPLNPELTVSRSFSLKAPLEEEKGFVAKGRALPFPGAEPPVVSTNLPEFYTYFRNRDAILTIQNLSWRCTLFQYRLYKLTGWKKLKPDLFGGGGFWRLVYPTELVNDENGLHILQKRRPK